MCGNEPASSGYNKYDKSNKNGSWWHCLLRVLASWAVTYKPIQQPLHWLLNDLMELQLHSLMFVFFYTVLNKHMLNLYVWPCGHMCLCTFPSSKFHWIPHPCSILQCTKLDVCWPVSGYLQLRDKTTHRDSKGTGAFCMHSIMYDPITLIVLAVRGNTEHLKDSQWSLPLHPVHNYTIQTHTHTRIHTSSKYKFNV